MQTMLHLLTLSMLIALIGAASPEGMPGSVKLPRPVLAGDTSLEKALQQRRSLRNYKHSPLSLGELSQLLWAAQGITAPDGRRTAPSAGGLFPLELYVMAGNVSGLEAGTYVYRPQGHELQRIFSGDRRAELSKAARGEPSILAAPAVLVLSAVFGRTIVKYGERGSRYVHMEAGHAAQNVYLEAAALELGTVVIGAFDDDAVKAAARLTIREQPLYLMPVGRQ